MNTVTIATDYPAVQVKCAACSVFKDTIKECREAKCCWAWARAGHEQRVADDARIAAEKDAQEGKAREGRG